MSYEEEPIIIHMTTEDALRTNARQLAQAQRELNRYMSTQGDQLSVVDEEYRRLRQTVKRLKLAKCELEEMLEEQRSTARGELLMSMNQSKPKEPVYANSRCKPPAGPRTGIRVGRRN